MSVHIEAKFGEIADTVLLPGDPLRAKFIAENFLQNAHCYNEVRGMLGFTGEYNGKKISVQGTGMGMPSMSIYATELFKFYDVQTAIRIGTCGSINENLKVRDIVLALCACSDSALLTQRFGARHFAPAADFSLLKTADSLATSFKIDHCVGSCVSSDLFYSDVESKLLWQKFGVLAVEMESAELYTLAAEYKRKALAIFTVSDHILTGESTTPQEREKTFTAMMKIALETASRGV